MARTGIRGDVEAASLLGNEEDERRLRDFARFQIPRRLNAPRRREETGTADV